MSRGTDGGYGPDRRLDSEEGTGAERGPGVQEGRVVASGVDRIAHQLKNPLQAISVNLEVLRLRATRSVGPDELEEIERLAGVVNENVRTLDRRIGLLVALARRGRGEEPPRRVALGNFVREASAAFRLDDREHARGVVLDLPGEEDDPEVRVQRGWLVAFLLRAMDCAAGDPPVLRVGSGPAGPRLTLTVDAAPEAEAASPEWWEGMDRAAERTGGELSREEGRVVLQFPAG